MTSMVIDISINCCVRLTFSNLILLYITLWDGKHKVQLFLKALSSTRSTAWVTPADCKKGTVEGFGLCQLRVNDCIVRARSVFGFW